MSLEAASELINQLEAYHKTHRLKFYEPYHYQREFHFAKGHGEFVPAPSDPERQGLAIHRALQCANQIGKTYCGGKETAFHLTGQYPDWWRGHIFKHPVEWICSSTTNETTRDRCQSELFGDPQDDEALGTGAIPIECIKREWCTKKPGVQNAFETALVTHVSGGRSKAYFKPYEQGYKKFMGYKVHGIWNDEEPPWDIWSQNLRSLLATNGIAYITYTPEEGTTEVVYHFMNSLAPGQALITATWDDAPHMTKERREQQLAAMSEHEREMRSKGIPLRGSGLIFPIEEERITCKPFEIPAHFCRIFGVDFGWDHPAALACMAWDRDSDIIYIYDVWKQSKALVEVHAQAIKSRGDWIPIAWPRDGLQHDAKSGKPFADLYRNMGCNMHFQPFSNPPAPGEKEGQGGYGVEVGISDILSRMETGRFKVFANCEDWFKEWRMYHRKDGQIVKLYDDLMSATRYAVMMRRHAITKPIRTKREAQVAGLANW